MENSKIKQHLIKAYDEKLAYEYLEFITKRPNDFICL